MKRIISFHPELVEILGEISHALVFQQLSYWSEKAKGDWFYKTVFDLEEETTIKRKAQENAINKLKEMGWIDYEIRKVGKYPKRHFKVLKTTKLIVSDKDLTSVSDKDLRAVSMDKDLTSVSSTIKDVQKITIAKATPFAPWSLEEALKKMESKPDTYLDHIATFIRCKNIKVENSKQLSAIITRNAKVAKQLEGWTSDDLYRTMEELQKKYEHEKKIKGELNSIDWGLETLLKKLTK